MTPAEYRSILARLDLSQAGAAKLLGIGLRQSARYAAGGKGAEIPEPTARLLRLLARGVVTPEQIERAAR
jgi:hypothetical protein